MPKLIAPSGHALALPGLPCRIGTARTNHIPIQEGLGVAGHHVTIVRMDKFVVIEDSGSGLGTYVNGALVERQVLQGGESIRIGTLELRFEHDDQPAAVAPAAGENAKLSPPSQAQTHQQQSSANAPPTPAAQIQPDQRAGLPPVNDKPAEAPLKDLFPKPSKGDRSVPGATMRREKPQLTDASPQEMTGTVALGGQGNQSKQPSRWLPVTLASIVVTTLITSGILVLKPQDSTSTTATESTSAEASSPAPVSSNQTSGSITHLAGVLASMTRPAAVITVDVSALREREWTLAVPRISSWLQKYLQLPINDVDQIVAVGAATEDFSIAITTVAPLAAADLTERLGPPQSENVFHLDALSGPLAVRLLDEKTLIVCHRDKASGPLQPSPLPEPLQQHLLSASGNVLLTIDHELVDKRSLPFFLPQPRESLKSKTAVLSIANSVQLRVATTHSSAQAADHYAKGYKQALAGSFKRFEDIDSAHIDDAVADIRSKATEETARILWDLKTGQDKFAHGLIEMIVDPLGTEVANASVQVLRQEAQRVAALYYTAKKAGAPLAGVSSTESAIALLIKGVESDADDWAGRPFRTRAYSSWEREVLAKFLEFDGSNLTFRPDGIPPSDLGTVIESQHAATEKSTPDPVETRSRLDAATIAAAYDAARTAGAELSNISKLDAALDQLAKGIEARGSRFAVQLSEEERERAKVFLRFQDDKIVLAEAKEE